MHDAYILGHYQGVIWAVRVSLLTLLSIRTLESVVGHIDGQLLGAFVHLENSSELFLSHRPPLHLPSPLPSSWLHSADAAVRGEAVVFMMQRLHCKGRTCQSLPEMKALHLSSHLLSACGESPASVGAVANEGANGLGPRRHYGVFIRIRLMFRPLVIWTLFHVHHQKDIKQDSEFKIRSQ